MKALLATLCLLSLLLGGVLFLGTLAGVDLDLGSTTTEKCTIGPPAGDINYEDCSGSEEGSGVLAVAVFGGSLLVTGGLLAVAATNPGRRQTGAPAPAPGWSAPRP